MKDSNVFSEDDLSRGSDIITRDQTCYTLAPVQRQALEYLKSFISRNGYAPTLKEISEFLGVRSASTAHFHLSRLEEKGFIRKGLKGSIELIDKKTEESLAPMSPNSVPLLGLIAAGAPIEAIEDNSVSIEIPPQYFDRKRELYCLQVTGDSMIDAHIMDGDIIIVEKKDSAENGQIVVALLDDDTATLKTFRRLKGGKVMLIPHNSNHAPITLNSVRIQGRLVGLMRELN
jgi:repressor LexA